MISYLKVLPLLGIFVFSGCVGSNKQVDTPKKVEKIIIKEIPAFSTSRIIPHDDKVNMGQYAEAWIAPYKDNEGNLYNERRINFWVINPSFNIGETLPEKSNKTDMELQKNLNIFSLDRKTDNTKYIDVNKDVIEYLEK
jgi:hypothetical protein